MYTYHDNDIYGLFSGTLSPTKTGKWTFYVGNGITQIPYVSSIQVNAGLPADGTMTYATAPFYQFDSVTVNIHIVDAYGNAVPNTPVPLSISGSGSPLILQPALTDINGNTIISEGPFNTTGNFQFHATASGVVINGPWLSILPPVPTNIALNCSAYVCYKNIVPLPAFEETFGLKDPISSNPAYVTAHITDSRGYPVRNVQVTFTVSSMTVKTSFPEQWLDDTLGEFYAYSNPGGNSTILYSCQYYYNSSNNSYTLSGQPTPDQITINTDANGNAFLYFTVSADAMFYTGSSYDTSDSVSQESIINASFTYNGNTASTNYTFSTVY